MERSSSFRKQCSPNVLLVLLILLLVPAARSSESTDGPRRGSRISSRYIKYVPNARYSRVNTHSTYYARYYSMYFYKSSSIAYLSQPYPKADSYVCANYEANENGTTMGIFTCPNSWEPDSFKYCCGKDYAEFCCEETESISSLIGDGSITTIVLCIIACFVIPPVVRLFRNRYQQSAARRTSVNVIPANVGPPPPTISSLIQHTVGGIYQMARVHNQEHTPPVNTPTVQPRRNAKAAGTAQEELTPKSPTPRAPVERSKPTAPETCTNEFIPSGTHPMTTVPSTDCLNDIPKEPERTKQGTKRPPPSYEAAMSAECLAEPWQK